MAEFSLFCSPDKNNKSPNKEQTLSLPGKWVGVINPNKESVASEIQRHCVPSLIIEKT